MLRIEARNSSVPIERKPDWIRTRLRTGPNYLQITDLVRRQNLHTVCQEAGGSAARSGDSFGHAA